MRSRSLPTFSATLLSLLAATLLGGGPAAASPVSSRFTPPIHESAPGSPAPLVVRHPTGTIFFTDRAVTLAMRDGQVVEWGPVGLERQPVPAEPLPGVVHDLVGSPERHRHDLKSWRAVRYPDVVNGTELVVESRPGGYAWSLHAPSATAAAEITLRYSGVDELSVDVKRSRLVARLERAELYESGLACSQPRLDGTTRPVRCLYGDAKKSGPRQWDYSIRVFDAEPGRPLLIDPDVTWAARIGGVEDDVALSVAFDEARQVVVTGAVVLSADFPGRPTPPRSENVAIVRLPATGEAFESVTFFGGNGGETLRDLKFGPDSKLYIAGETVSSNLSSFGSDAADETHAGGRDAYVCRLAADASQVELCTYVGGEGLGDGTGDEYLTGIAFESGGGIVAVGSTLSTKFYGQSPKGQDAFIVRLTQSLEDFETRLVLGGTGTESVHALAIDAAGAVFIGGSSDSSELTGAPETDVDGFVVRVSADAGGTPTWAFLGGSSEDAVKGLVVSSTRKALFILGETSSSSGKGAFATKWPVRGTDLDQQIEQHDLFLTRMPLDMSDIEWSMLLGGAADERAVALGADRDVTLLYLVGNSLAPDGAVRTDLPGLNYFDGEGEGESEVVLAAVDPEGRHHWSSYFGGPGSEKAGAIAVRPNQMLYIAGETSGAGFPISGGGVDDSSTGSDSDVFVAAIRGDKSAPLAGVVFDGSTPGVDLAEQTDTTRLSAAWEGFADPESGIARYEVGIGSTADDADLKPFEVAQALDRHTFSDLTLQLGETYFVIVRATNGVGVTTTKASDGVTIVEPAPDAGHSPDAGHADAGVSDAGALPDEDAGVDPLSPGGGDGETPVLGWRCAAAGAGSAAPGLLLMLTGLLLAGRRRA